MRLCGTFRLTFGTRNFKYIIGTGVHPTSVMPKEEAIAGRDESHSDRMTIRPDSCGTVPIIYLKSRVPKDSLNIPHNPILSEIYKFAFLSIS